jgi:transcriptional regulator with XRE-family HTH domain
MKKHKNKSHIMEVLQLLILLENEPDYKIAARCGVAPSTILNIRHGNHYPLVNTAEQIYEELTGNKICDIFNHQ